jgi:glycosyltransferase involved in cell wall biosynthesis
METRSLQGTLPGVETEESPETPPAHSRETHRADPLISVIIPAHNEETYLPATLDALKRQNYPAIEVIVVANGCTDETADAAHGRCDRLIVLSQKSLGVARNLGARMAKGELLVFLDADTCLEPLTLRLIAQNFSRDEAAGTIKGRPDADTPAFSFIYGLKNFMHQTNLHNGSSGVIICWKEHFLRVGGFDEGLEVRENSELIRRLKKFGNYKYIGEVAATTSMRRYEQCGVWPTIWLWIKVWFQTRFGDLHHRRYQTVR